MFKRNILVVDDELPILEWLKFTIEKELGDTANVVTAKNGLDAWDKFKNHSFDIVFTDIKMPKSDGFELIKRIRSLNPDIYIVVLTSYNDFEYARAAVTHKANDYILKTEITGELMKQIISTKSVQKAFHMPIRSIEDISNLIKEDNTLSNNHAPSNMYCCFAINLYDDNEPNIITDSNFNRILFEKYDYNAYIYVIEIINQNSFLMQTNAIYNYTKVIKELNPEATIAYSGIKHPNEDLISVIHKVINALSYSFYINDQIIHADSLPDSVYTNSINSIDTVYLSIIQEIKQNQFDKISDLIQVFFNKLKNDKPLQISKIINLCKNICLSLISSVFTIGDESSLLIEKTETEFSQIKKFDNLHASTINIITEVINSSKSKRLDNIYIQAALDYILLNYSTINNISEVADFVNLKTDSFSKQFKETLGISFNTYLTEFRLKKAAELIQTTDKSLSEIALAVGFSSLSYFSKCYKKYYGENPFSLKKGIL